MDEITNSELRDFTMSLNRAIDRMTSTNETGTYNPYLGEQFLQEIMMSPQKVDNKRLATILAHPHKYAKTLRDFAQYLENNIMQYMRTVDYFASMLTYRYERIPLDNADVIKKLGRQEEYIDSMYKVDKYLQKFKLKEKFHAISSNVVSQGACFYYIKETPKATVMVELPKDYCTITGKGEYGWTFGINLMFFDKFNGLKDVIPELYEQYKIFCIMRDAKHPDTANHVFYQVPPEIGWCFCFDENRPDQSPPLKQLFKDTLAIVDYKDLLRTKVMLDTVMMLIQEIPLDKDTNRPMMTRAEAEDYVAMTQSNLPVGVKTTATPLKCDLKNFSSAQTQNNIIGLGDANFYNSAGVSPILFGGESKSSLALSYSTLVDYGFVEHLYNQYMNFINFRLRQVSSKYRWEILMYGNKYTENEDIKTRQTLVQSLNMPMSCLSSYLYEPWQYDNMVALEGMLKTKENTQPILAGSQMSSDDIGNASGRPESDAKDLKESGEITREHDSNANAQK